MSSPVSKLARDVNNQTHKLKFFWMTIEPLYDIIFIDYAVMPDTVIIMSGFKVEVMLCLCAAGVLRRALIL